MYVHLLNFLHTTFRNGADNHSLTLESAGADPRHFSVPLAVRAVAGGNPGRAVEAGRAASGDTGSGTDLWTVQADDCRCLRTAQVRGLPRGTNWFGNVHKPDPSGRTAAGGQSGRATPVTAPASSFFGICAASAALSSTAVTAGAGLSTQPGGARPVPDNAVGPGGLTAAAPGVLKNAGWWRTAGILAAAGSGGGVSEYVTRREVHDGAGAHCFRRARGLGSGGTPASQSGRARVDRRSRLSGSGDGIARR